MGVFLGVVVGELEMTAVDPSFREQVRSMLRPNTSILFVVTAIRPEQAIAALSQYGGATLRCSLATGDIAELWDGLHTPQVRA